MRMKDAVIVNYCVLKYLVLAACAAVIVRESVKLLTEHVEIAQYASCWMLLKCKTPHFSHSIGLH